MKKKMHLILQGYQFIFRGAGREACFMLLLKGVYGIAPFCNAWLMSRFTDLLQRGTAGRALDYLAYLAVFQLFMMLASVLNNYVNSLYYNKILMYSYAFLAEKVQHISSEYFEVEENQRKIDYITGNAIWAPFRIFNVSMNVVQASICLVSFLFFIFRSNGLITVFFLAAILLYMAISGRQGQKTYSLSNDLQDRERQVKNLSSILYETKYAKELRVYQYGEYLIRIWKDLMLSLIRPRLRLSTKNSIARNCYRIGLNMFLLMYFVAIGVGISRGVMTAGMLSAMAAYVADLNYAIGTLGGFMEMMGENVELLAVLFDYVKEIEDQDRHGTMCFSDSGLSGGFRGEIRIRNLSFFYPNTDKAVLKDINLDIKSGEHIALVGKNGAGKTTLAYLLAGVYRPTEGDIYIDGVNIASLRSGELSRHIAMVSQKIQRFSLSLEDNIILGRTGRQNDMDELLSDMGLGDVVRSLEHGRKEMLGKEFGKTDLSGGEWQKLALARCFAFEKEIYLLDEPTSALDPHMEHRLFRLFEKYSRNKTSVIISHRLGAIRQCDRLCFLEDGRIVNMGTHDELMAECPDYARLYHAQAKWFRKEGE